MPALVPREVYHAGARALPTAVRRGAARPFQLIVAAIFSRPRRRRSRQEGHHRHSPPAVPGLPSRDEPCFCRQSSNASLTCTMRGSVAAL